MSRRWVLIATIAVVAVQCLVWLFAAAVVWSVRDVMVGASSRAAAQNARFGLEIFAAAGINVIALIIFVLRNRQAGWWLLATIQLVDLILTVVEGALVQPAWWILSALEAVALILLYLLRPRAPAPLVDQP